MVPPCEIPLAVVVLGGVQGVGTGAGGEAMCRSLGISSLLRVDLEGAPRVRENPASRSERCSCSAGCTAARGWILADSNPVFDKEDSTLPERARARL